MPAIDDAAVRVTPPDPSAAPSRGAARRRPLPAVARVALAFVALWPPLTLVALATEWRGSWEVPDGDRGLLAEYLLHGSAISGPVFPQLLLLALALAARGERLTGRLATAAIGVMGALIAFNGSASALTEADHAPQAAATVAGVVLAAFGVAMAVLAAQRLLRRGR